MKKGKLLFLTPAVALATVAPIVSCGEPAWTIDDLVDAVFNPKDDTPRPEDCNTFLDCLSALSVKEQQKELIYSLFLQPVCSKHDFIGDVTISDLWKDEYLVMSANINKCSLDFKEDGVYANFTGYINFIFQKEYTPYEVNDFIQITLLVDDLRVLPKASQNWHLYFPHPGDIGCWGFFQEKKNGQTHLYYIADIGWMSTMTNYPKNWHDWIES